MPNRERKVLENINNISVKADVTRDRFNKGVILFVLLVVLLTIVCRIVTSILLDIGYYHGHVTVHYWDKIDPEFRTKAGLYLYKDITFEKSQAWLKIGNNADNPDFIRWIELSLRSQKHPNFFWTLTQFTWQTTIIIFLIFSFRFLMYNGNEPKKLKWINKQETLTLLTIYDLIVGIVFWTALYNEGFADSFSKDPIIRTFELITTVLVHTIVPFLLFLYSISFLLLGRTAKRVDYKYILYGAIYPIVYGTFYIIISFIWIDPYPVTSLSDIITNKQNHLKEVWKMPVALFGIISSIGIFILIHNKLIIYNKFRAEEVKIQEKAAAKEKEIKKVEKQKLKIEKKEIKKNND